MDGFLIATIAVLAATPPLLLYLCWWLDRRDSRKEHGKERKNEV
jgi:hypothetical protein